MRWVESSLCFNASRKAGYKGRGKGYNYQNNRRGTRNRPAKGRARA